MSLRIRRGTDAQRQGITFDLGEPVFTTDTQKLYIGDGVTAGGKNILATSAGTGLTWNATTQTLNVTGGGGGITAVIQDTAPQLGGNLSLNSFNITGTGNINVTSTAFSLLTNDVGLQFSNTGDPNGFHVLFNTGGSLSSAGSLGLLVSRGTLASPANVGANDVLGAYTVKGYYNGVYVPGVALGVNYASNAVMTSAFPASRLGIVVGNNTSSPITYTFDNNGIAAAPVLKTASTTVAGLISASTAGAGARAFVTDATSNTFGSPANGSGTYAVPVYSDGTSWHVG